MRLVVLDINVLVQHMAPSSALRLIGREVAAKRMRLVVPEVVVLETVNRRVENLVAAVEKARSAIRALRRLDGGPDLAEPEVNLASFRDQADHELRSLISRLGGDVVPIPTSAHVDLVQRSLSRQQPFDKTDRGYRDTLIWESVRSLIGQDQQITLV